MREQQVKYSGLDELFHVLQVRPFAALVIDPNQINAALAKYEGRRLATQETHIEIERFGSGVVLDASMHFMIAETTQTPEEARSLASSRRHASSGSH